MNAFFWVDEESEVFFARDIEAINKYLDRGHEDYPLLTPENKGEVWGDADPTGIVKDAETGKEYTFKEASEQWGFQDCNWFKQKGVAQICTCYA
jgi:hypothetical protein